MTMKSLLSLLALAILSACNAMSEDEKKSTAKPEIPAGAETLTLGAGCFWCVEAVFEQIDGVHSSTSGYMGGSVADPSYQAICSGTTGHAEVVQIVFDPKKTSAKKLLSWFWELHDPTTLNRQGADVGSQYRSAIFYHNEEQKTLAEASKTAATEDFEDPIVTEITKASTFYPADNYHQDYYSQNKSNNGYCRLVIEPKLKKLKLKH